MMLCTARRICSSRPGTTRNISAEHVLYGEGQTNDQALNLRTRIFQQFDGAGVATNNQFDFKGNLLNSTRQLLSGIQE